MKKLTLIERVDLSKIRKVHIETLEISKITDIKKIADIVRNTEFTFENLEVSISCRNAPNLLRSINKHRKDIKKVYLNISMSS